MNKLTLSEVVEKIAKKEISSVEMAHFYLDKIEVNNPKINGYITVNEAVVEQAQNLDQSTEDLPLKGVPIAIKDNFLTKGLRTTAASNVLEDYMPQYSATVVERLKMAGALVLGKTNLDSWAHGSSTETSDFGITKNPWDISRLPGGSSGGSAAVVSADMAPAAIGSETAGSIRQPSAWCGNVGLKPTYGRVSRYGVIAMASSTDSPGPMTKTVKDAAFLLEILAGKDYKDATTSTLPVETYTSFLGKGVKDLRIGIAANYLLEEMSPEVKQLILDAGKVLEGLGAKVEMVELMSPEYAISVYTIIQRSEVSSNLARYTGVRYGKDREAFGQEAKRRMMLGTFALSAGYAEQYYKKAQKVRTLYIQDFERIFKDYDVILSPTSPGTAKKIGASEGQAMFGEMEDMLLEPSSIAGLPGINVPCGFVEGLPIGLDIIGSQFQEGKIIQVASAYEGATEWHKQWPKVEKSSK